MSFGKCNSFLCLSVCAHVRVFTQLSGAKRIDLLIPSIFVQFSSLSPMPYPTANTLGTVTLQWDSWSEKSCVCTSFPQLISYGFISTGHDQIKTLTHLLTTIYKHLTAASDGLAGDTLFFPGPGSGECPPSVGNLAIRGQLVLNDLSRARLL